MSKRLTILILLFSMGTALTQSSLSPGKPNQRLLREGFVLKGIDGQLSVSDQNDAYFFQFDSDVSDGKATVVKGTKLQILPSATLERMLSDANKRPAANYRLWGKTTCYKGENFIFPVYFLPLTKLREPEQTGSEIKIEAETSQQTQRTKSDDTKERTDDLEIPSEVTAQLRARLRISSIRPAGQQTHKQDMILIDRMGFILSDLVYGEYGIETNTQYDPSSAVALLRRMDIRNTQYYFVFDSFGRNVNPSQLGLLPCKALESTEWLRSLLPEPVRFKVAGITTEYKGQKYLMLHKATRVFSHGNFDR
jgi:hypothetical protein